MATLVQIAGCSGQEAATTAPHESSPMRLVAYSGCVDLLKGLREAAAERVGPTGLPGSGTAFGAQERGPSVITRDGAEAAPEKSTGEAAGAPGYSGTNVHEQGVDEPDPVKTDGKRIVALIRGTLKVVDPTTRMVVHQLDLTDPSTGAQPTDLLLSGDRALVIIRQAARLRTDASPLRRPGPPGVRMRLQLVDLSGAPRVLSELSADGEVMDARQVGGIARVVVRTFPRIEFEPPPTLPTPDGTAIERNRRTVRQAPLEAWLPRFEVSAGPARKTHQVPCDRVSHPAGSAGTSMLSVLTFDLARELGNPDPVSVAADAETVYGTAASLYIAGTSPLWTGPGPLAVPPARGASPARRGLPRTVIHRFDITGCGRPRYTASGSVPGTLLNQYSLSEHAGHLRVATTQTRPSREDRAPAGPRPAPAVPSTESTVHVLATRGARLDPVGKVGGLGRGERIYAVRFIGPAGYVVTFRQVDPLYTLDLRDPRRPAVTGELKIAGYSAYLHPAGDDRLLGLGQDADARGVIRGTQVSLFDVSGAPRRIALHRIAGTASAAETDPHAFLYWARTGLTVVPVTARGGRTEALVLAINGDRLRRVGAVRHPGDRAPIRRSLVIGDTLWTVSDEGARASDATTLAGRGWVAF